MADFWKSHAKKFCDFCKCWIADNKPSIEFHERGKRHKENVTLRLKTIHRNSAKQHKDKKKLDEDFKKMEKAALEAYMKDVQQNADFTSKMLNEQLSISKSSTSSSVDHNSKEQKIEEESDKSESETSHVWYEALSDEGYTYYWNTITGESVWEPPDSGYTSLDVQKKWEEREKRQEAKMKVEEERRKKEEARQKEEEIKTKSEELRAYIKREEMKKRAIGEKEKEKRTETASTSTMVMGPAPRGNPYGSWTAVKKSEPKLVDLQLPEQKRVLIKVPVLMPNESEVKFKEKNINSLEDGAGTSGIFKKRKMNVGSKRNLRQRVDDE